MIVSTTTLWAQAKIITPGPLYEWNEVINPLLVDKLEQQNMKEINEISICQKCSKNSAVLCTNSFSES